MSCEQAEDAFTDNQEHVDAASKASQEMKSVMLNEIFNGKGWIVESVTEPPDVPFAKPDKK